MTQTVIELTPEDTLLFIQFRKHQDQFKTLLQHGVFSEYCGYKAIHKDGKNLRLIETHFAEKLV